MRKNTGLSFYKKRKKISASTLREIFTWIFGSVVAILLAFLMVISVGMQIRMIGVSMEPVLYNEQQIFVNEIIYNFTSPKRGHVIVFLPNGNENSHYYVKRVVGLPGEEVHIKEGRLFIDGVQVNDHYDEMADYGIADDPIILEEDEYFVLGDNRNSSEDSRSGNIGTIHKDVIAGKAWLHMAGGDNGIDFIK